MVKALLVMCALLLAGCASPQESGVKVIVGAKLNAWEYSVVVIADGKFRAVGPQASTPVPKGSKIASGLGMSIEPAPGGEPIEAGRAANLILKSSQAGTPDRVMRNGQWVR